MIYAPEGAGRPSSSKESAKADGSSLPGGLRHLAMYDFVRTIVS